MIFPFKLNFKIIVRSQDFISHWSFFNVFDYWRLVCLELKHDTYIDNITVYWIIQTVSFQIKLPTHVNVVKEVLPIKYVLDEEIITIIIFHYYHVTMNKFELKNELSNSVFAFEIWALTNPLNKAFFTR